MSYYSYHAVNRQRIENGELVDCYFDPAYKRIGKALVLVFSTCSPSRPSKRPIRPKRWAEYIPLIEKRGIVCPV